MTLNDKNDWLEIHVFGSDTQGEGIVLKLPDNQYAVVDCCFTGDIDDPGENPVLDFLRRRRVKKLAFACLTHPHEDHYFGLSQIIKETPPKLFFQSNAMQPHDLMRVIFSEKLYAARIGSAHRSRTVKELERIRAVVTGLKGECEERTAIGDLRIYPSRQANKPSFEIVAVAPFDAEIRAYQSQLRKCFNEDYTPRFDEFPSIDHNRISVGLLIKTKYFNVILGGDVLVKNWLEAIQRLPHDWLHAKLVKVSHHGSHNGKCDGLWELLGTKEPPIAVITRFSASNLPRPDMLSFIQSRTSAVYMTHSNLPERDMAIARSRERMAVLSEFFHVDLRPSDLSAGFEDVRKLTPSAYGRCSFYFSKKGDVRTNVSPLASQL